MQALEIAVLTECLACFERGTECRVIHRDCIKNRALIEFDDPPALLKVRTDQIRSRYIGTINAQ